MGVVISENISKKDIVTIKDRKSHVAYQMAPVPIRTLSSIEDRGQTD